MTQTTGKVRASVTAVSDHAQGNTGDVEEQIRFVHHPDFDNHEASHNILETMPDSMTDEDSGQVKRIRGRDYVLSDRPLLTKQAERALFLRMNLLRCMAARRQLEVGRAPKPEVCRRSVKNLQNDAIAARNEIVAANQRLVVSNAARYLGRGVPMADLVSEGNLALMKAIDHFDVSLGWRLSTYATYAIRRHLGRFVQQEQKRAAACSEAPVDVPVEDESAEWIDMHPRTLIETILSSMPQRERTMVALRYGLAEGEPCRTLDEIGQRFGLSKERIRQLISRTCAKACQQHARRLGLGEFA